MSIKTLPRHANLEQYRKQAKDLVKLRQSPDTAPRHLERLFKLIQQFHPRYRKFTAQQIATQKFALSDAQLVLAREHGFESWPKFAKHIEAAQREASGAPPDSPEYAFLRSACTSPGIDHRAGTIEDAEAILSKHPEIADNSIFVAAVIGNADRVQAQLRKAADAETLATTRGGPYGWDALTSLCFSRYLRASHEDKSRSRQFVEIARALLEAGASADTGWFEENDEPVPFWESAIYGAAAVTGHAELTQLLLDHGADPNDEETAYHAAEGYDHAVLKVLLDSGKLNHYSLTTLLLRKGDWHDQEGMKLVLEAGANPNSATHWDRTPIQHTLLRDNDIDNITMQLDHWPKTDGRVETENVRHGESMAWIAARRGRRDVLELLGQRGFPIELTGAQALIAACARGDRAEATAIAQHDPSALHQLKFGAGILLAEFAGNGNVEGLGILLDLGLDVGTPNPAGDGYYGIEKYGTALHTAAWRMQHEAVRLLLDRGVLVNATDAKGQTALMLAVKACVDSYWRRRRKPISIAMLLDAGASTSGITIPTGYAEADALLIQHNVKA